MILISISIIFTFVCPVYGAYEASHYFSKVEGNNLILSPDFNYMFAWCRIVYNDNDGVGDYITNYQVTNKLPTFQINDYMKSGNFYCYPFGGSNFDGDYISFSDYQDQFYINIDHNITVDLLNPNILVNSVDLCIRYRFVDGSSKTESINLNVVNGRYQAESAYVVPSGTVSLTPYYRVRTSNTDETLGGENFYISFSIQKFDIQFELDIANEIFDGLFNDPETEGEANDFNIGMNSTIEQNQSNKNQASDFNRPDPGDLKTQFNPYQYIGSNSVALFTDTIAMITQAPIIVTMLSVCIGVCAVSYVFFGKKR